MKMSRSDELALRADRVMPGQHSNLPGYELFRPIYIERGQGMHHVCLEVDDIEEMMAHLKANGIKLINSEPRISSDGRKYAFLHPKSTLGVMIELYQLSE